VVDGPSSDGTQTPGASLGNKKSREGHKRWRKCGGKGVGHLRLRLAGGPSYFIPSKRSGAEGVHLPGVPAGIMRAREGEALSERRRKGEGKPRQYRKGCIVSPIRGKERRLRAELKREIRRKTLRGGEKSHIGGGGGGENALYKKGTTYFSTPNEKFTPGRSS